ncbi:hypothetical protein O6H91_18G023800 [Diphasiastrum complanatum]|uniref:Uncharacterized protein n=1 Tax=Diphasiastrum complanatum TaxID=34168 RepID=A0ACC2AYX4_DIPCM|nr:hypothetical protein O6H91_18G023800 [Diphasiastrum complanatum]
MTADSVENGSQPGSNSPFPSQVRAVYDQDMPSAVLTFDGNKVGLNLGAGKVASPGRVKEKERVYSQDETENRISSLLSGSPTRGIKSKNGGTYVQEGAPDHLLVHGGYLKERENLTMSAYMRKFQLQDTSEMDESQRRDDRDEKLEGTDEAEAKLSMGFKSQSTTAAPQAPQLQQFQHSQQQYSQQGVSGGWENFLPHRNLRILLVEDDDSTRHVVGALLRNCGYEVTMAASGVQAWELLQDKSSHFDLALTEVILPSLSGISLLSKIMNHESCKHIPVVMMSSLDAVDVVFKCLSKGAVDFLVKPVRKNELKNLWQHVWRKCHSSSGSGSGSGSHTGKVAGLKDMNDTANNSESESSSLNGGGGSDNGSGTQSFWTKRRVEVESPGRPTEWDAAHRPHGALAHADIQTNVGVLPKDRRKLCLDAQRGQANFKAKAPDRRLGKNPEIAAPRAGALEFQVANSAHLQDANQTMQKVLPIQDVEQHDSLNDEGMADRVGGTLTFGTKVIDLLGNIACQPKSKENHHSTEDGETLDRGASNSPKTKDNISSSISLPTLELTLKRSHTTDEEDGKAEDRQVLRQSGASAFSRYNNSGVVLHQHPHFPVGSYTLSSFPLQGGYGGQTTKAVTGMGANQIGVLRTASPADRAGPFKGNEVSAPVPSHAQLAPAGNNQDVTPSVVGSSGQEVLAQPAEEDGASASGMPISIAVPSPAMLSFNGVGAFGPSRNQVFYTHSSKSPWAATTRVPDQGEGYGPQQFEDHGLPHQAHQQTYHHHNHHYHHHHVQHHYHHHRARAKLESPESPEDEQTVTNPGTGAPRCGSSNMIGHGPGNLGQSGSSNGYGANGNGNGSMSGSNNGSNNHIGNSNGQSGIMATAGGNGDSGNNNGNSGSGNGHGISSVNGGNGNGNGVVVGPEQNSFTRREAALNKFRQKRKERCFEKKKKACRATTSSARPVCATSYYGRC